MLNGSFVVLLPHAQQSSLSSKIYRLFWSRSFLHLYLIFIVLQRFLIHILTRLGRYIILWQPGKKVNFGNFGQSASEVFLYLTQPLHLFIVEMDAHVANLRISATMHSNTKIFCAVAFGGIDEDWWAALPAFRGNAICDFPRLLVQFKSSLCAELPSRHLSRLFLETNIDWVPKNTNLCCDICVIL